MQGQGPSNVILPSVNYVFTEHIIYSFQILFLSLHGQDEYSCAWDVHYEAKTVRKELGIEVVPVAIGENAFVHGFKNIASMPDRVVSCGVNEDPSKLGDKLLRGNHSIPYFVMRTSVIHKQCRRSGRADDPTIHVQFCIGIYFQPKLKVTAQLCLLVFWLYNRILRL